MHSRLLRLLAVCVFCRQAMLAAYESMNVDPTVAKSWCRLGDAYRDLGRYGAAAALASAI
jgi:cytochrome c-type biogenesis protein CcmH/NrfG